MTRLILLDRDGVINHDSTEYIKSVDEFIPIEGSLLAIARLHAQGFKIAICTNQSAVGRGLMSLETLNAIHQHLGHSLAGLGAVIDGLSICPHPPDGDCDCRKPRPGMLLEQMHRFQVTPGATVFVGDSMKDLEAAQAAGCQPILVRTGNGSAVESQAARLGVIRIYDDLASFATAEISAQQAREAAQQ